METIIIAVLIGAFVVGVWSAIKPSKDITYEIPPELKYLNSLPKEAADRVMRDYNNPSIHYYEVDEFRRRMQA